MTQDPSASGPASARRIAIESIDLASLRIVLWPDPRLKKASEPVEEFGPALTRLADRMLELMREHKGVGLAAPQVGLNLRLFVANPTGEAGDDHVYVNPELRDADGGDEREEGCLSIPDVNVVIGRPSTLTIRAQDPLGAVFEQTATGFLTRVWQHETDHLNGRLILDHMGPMARMAYRKTLKKLEDDFAELQAGKKKKKTP